MDTGHRIMLPKPEFLKRKKLVSTPPSMDDAWRASGPVVIEVMLQVATAKKSSPQGARGPWHEIYCFTNRECQAWR